MHRTQILFPKWLNEFVNATSSHCKISKGEMIRGLTCLGILKSMELKNRPVENYQHLLKQLSEILNLDSENTPEKVSDFHDNLFYETRKAVEIVLDEMKKKNS